MIARARNLIHFKRYLFMLSMLSQVPMYPIAYSSSSCPSRYHHFNRCTALSLFLAIACNFYFKRSLNHTNHISISMHQENEVWWCLHGKESQTTSTSIRDVHPRWNCKTNEIFRVVFRVPLALAHKLHPSTNIISTKIRCIRCIELWYESQNLWPHCSMAQGDYMSRSPWSTAKQCPKQENRRFDFAGLSPSEESSLHFGLSPSEIVISLLVLPFFMPSILGERLCCLEIVGKVLSTDLSKGIIWPKDGRASGSSTQHDFKMKTRCSGKPSGMVGLTFC